ncbi:hypothetical protein [Paenibacillus sp. FSL R7-0273]|uniref:hypothetical protein n=1 Tax=Paenibacillus sp. FSL R7-0273 TaxID=1536772 RepID=UPI00097B80BE|nr:hypothetical protein [Paenibacillus sp. FSL R7-0273]OMF85299.1 hypothetical protein BK144_28155 [Paenibacillus sp. FSL R7-0273]
MNVIILLFSLLSSYMSPSAQREEVPAAFFSMEPQAVLAFERHTVPDPYISSFDSLAGAALFTSTEELLLNKGTPLNIAPDPWQECLEYHYADMTAGICGGIVTYVHVDPAQAGLYGLRLNGVSLNPAADNVRELLGNPDFIADDGDVYIRGSAALKIYRNPFTGEWDGIDLFDANAS